MRRLSKALRKSLSKKEEEAKPKALDRPSAQLVKKEAAKIDAFRWIRLSKLVYKDEKGVERPWECAERTTRKGDVDAVFVVASLEKKGESPKILLISQYRPPVDAYVIEFPAGLVDQGETPKDAALRELKEETGYVGQAMHTSPIVVADPGMTNANLCFVYVKVDLDKPENRIPVAEQEDGENIQSHLVPKDKLFDVLNDPKKSLGLEDRPNVIVDSRLYSVAMGIGMF